MDDPLIARSPPHGMACQFWRLLVKWCLHACTYNDPPEKLGISFLAFQGHQQWQAASRYPRHPIIHSNYGPVSYRFRDKWQFRSKNANFPYHCTQCLCWGVTIEYCYDDWATKTRMLPCQMAKIVWRYVYSFRQKISTWQADRQTNGEKCHMGVVCQALTRDKNLQKS